MEMKLILETSLIDTLTYEDKSMISYKSCSKRMIENVRNLLGHLIINPQKLYGLDGDLGLWFTFNDLSVCKEGDYMLRFRLFYNGRLPSIVNDIECEYISEITFIESRPFVVYKKSQYPGDIAPTLLSINFYEQGVNIPLGSSVLSNRNNKFVEVIFDINENDYFENLYEDDEFYSDYYEEFSDDDKMNVDES
ncbi:3091_t:CDS:2 [Funneliformis caledonium]|uniref:3091_t:CDS:1 n=1 Tax=Funneliformis caledonium TaxID=1117310 RepID=A0A9N9GQS6_9GLOM|nr:3091_t:CDS:2 [Funneliformis caledonium]